MNDNFPIIVSMKKYSAYNYLRNATIKHHLPAQNYYEFNCIDNGLNIKIVFICLLSRKICRTILAKHCLFARSARHRR